MSTLTTIQAENIDQGIYNFFTNTLDQYTNKPITYGQAITELLDGYIDFAKGNHQFVTEKIEEYNNRPYPTTSITIQQVNPQIHKRFKKYLQKKYKTRKIKEHYNQELNTALILYVSIVQLPIVINDDAWNQAIEREDLDTKNAKNGYDLLKEEFTLLCNEYNITPQQADIYGLF